MILSVIYMMAQILAIVFLFRMGGVLPIICAIVLMLGLIPLAGGTWDLVKEDIQPKEKRKEEET